MATETVTPLVLRGVRFSWILRRGLRCLLEHFHDPWPLPRLQPSMALDGMSEVRGLVVTRGMVRG